jgi:predicted ATPase
VEDIGFNAFLVLDQLSMGIGSVDDEEEKCRIAVLCLRAGERASQSSAFLAAGQCVDLGISLLSRRQWRDEKAISLAIFRARAEVEYVLGAFDKNGRSCQRDPSAFAIFSRQAPGLRVKVYYLAAKNQPELAIQTGLNVLKKLGQPFPTKGRIIYIYNQGAISDQGTLRKFDDYSISR